MQLLSALAIPIVLAAAGFWFTTQQDARLQRIENQRAQAERDLAEQHAQDEALQAYLDQMSSLLLDKDLRASEEDSEVRTLARARTLTVLERLDPNRKTELMRFLQEADLVQRVDGKESIIALRGANLSGTSLNFADLSGVDLSDAKVTDKQLELVKSLEGATMPNGQKYEEWQNKLRGKFD